MGAYNRLHTPFTCPDCNQQFAGILQFKYGHTWQLNYHLEDTLQWGGNDIGSPDFKKVRVYGIMEVETCPLCHSFILQEDYDILVENNTLKSITPLASMKDYLEAPAVDGDYIPLE